MLGLTVFDIEQLPESKVRIFDEIMNIESQFDGSSRQEYTKPLKRGKK